MAYLLDTNICVFILRGKLDIDQISKQKNSKELFISEVTIFELRYGAENSNNPDRSNEAVDIFLRKIIPIPIVNCVNVYAEEKARLRKIGKPMHDDFDLLIGATAIQKGLILVTENVKDFERLENIKIENWMKRKAK